MSGPWRCVNDHPVTDPRATSCPSCGGDVQWDRGPTGELVLDAETDDSGGASGWLVVALGAVLSVLGGAVTVSALGEDDAAIRAVLGALVAVAGQALFLVGVVAEGVGLALRQAGLDRSAPPPTRPASSQE